MENKNITKYHKKPRKTTKNHKKKPTKNHKKQLRFFVEKIIQRKYFCQVGCYISIFPDFFFPDVFSEYPQNT